MIKKAIYLLKGSLQRKMKADPTTIEAGDQRRAFHQWVKYEQGSRGGAGRIEGNYRKRALHKLSSKTKTIHHEDGTRSFLLHRGMSEAEHKGSVKEGHYNNKELSSWTPHEWIAHTHAKNYNGGKVVSSWVHEKHIHSVPRQFGGRSEESSKHPVDQMIHKREHEVVVDSPNAKVHKIDEHPNPAQSLRNEGKGLHGSITANETSLQRLKEKRIKGESVNKAAGFTQSDVDVESWNEFFREGGELNTPGGVDMIRFHQIKDLYKKVANFQNKLIGR